MNLVLPLLAQQCYPQQASTWGPVACGTQISIAITNGNVKIGSNVTVAASIRNSSSNVVSLAISYEPLEDFVVTLRESSGTEHQLKPEATGLRFTPILSEVLIGSMCSG